MAEYVLAYSLSACSDAAIEQYRVVRITGSNLRLPTVDKPLGSTQGHLFGVLTSKCPAALRTVAVTVLGECIVEAAGVVAAGALLTADANGRVTAAVSGDYSIGSALESAGALGEQIRALIGFGTRVMA